MNEGTMNDSHIATLDVGTSSVRCLILNKSGDIVGSSNKAITLLYPEAGWVEIEPEHLWTTVLEVIDSAIRDAHLHATDISCIGISTARCTIITWDKSSGKHFHNFITWKDLRADSLVKQHNSSCLMQMMRIGARCLYTVSRQKRFLAASDLKAMNVQIVCRLEWILQEMPEVREAAEAGRAVYGMIDSWLLYKLTGGKLHVTDASCASASGAYDPFTMEYSAPLLWMYHIPRSMMPTVCDSAGEHFGSTDAKLFGQPIPIRSSLGDQSASLFGSCCFKEGDTKVTLGTGTFLDVNTGRKPHASISGLYPVVAWRFNDELVYMAEGSSSDTASLIHWLLNMGLCGSAFETARVATSVQNSNGVLFVPSFSGINAPINDSQAAAGFIGVKPTTKPAHLVRAVLESIALRVAQVYELLTKETSYNCSVIKVDGGVSSNDFIVQTCSDLTGVTVQRSENVEMSALGAAYMAGIGHGIWKSKEDISKLRRVEGKTFRPRQRDENLVKDWKKAVNRFLHWYS